MEQVVGSKVRCIKTGQCFTVKWTNGSAVELVGCGFEVYQLSDFEPAGDDYADDVFWNGGLHK